MDGGSSEPVARRQSATDRLFGDTGSVRGDSEARALDRVRLVVWVALAAAFVLFLALGSVTIHTGSRVPQSAKVTEVWSGKADTLPEVGHETLLQVSFLAAVALFIASVIVGFGIMLQPGSTNDSEPRDRADEPARADHQETGPVSELTNG